jgi:hypothetical protein
MSANTIERKHCIDYARHRDVIVPYVVLWTSTSPARTLKILDAAESQPVPKDRSVQVRVFQA